MNLVWVGLGQEIQQEKEKLIRKCLVCSAPALALKLLKTFGYLPSTFSLQCYAPCALIEMHLPARVTISTCVGVDVKKEAVKKGIEIPSSL
jgi:hypothetical protein